MRETGGEEPCWPLGTPSVSVEVVQLSTRMVIRFPDDWGGDLWLRFRMIKVRTQLACTFWFSHRLHVPFHYNHKTTYKYIINLVSSAKWREVLGKIHQSTLWSKGPLYRISDSNIASLQKLTWCTGCRILAGRMWLLKGLILELIEIIFAMRECQTNIYAKWDLVIQLLLDSRWAAQCLHIAKLARYK